MKVIIIGYGKMGHEIEQILRARGHEIEAIVDAGDDLSATLGGTCGEMGMASENAIAGSKKIDVAIEFSTPETAFDNIKKCLEMGIPVVSGTTGWTAQMAEIQRLCSKLGGAFFYASNYSIGVNVMFELNRRLAEIMNRFPDYDVTVEELHHTQKKDAPSGTAIVLADEIVAALDRKNEWTGATTTDPQLLEVLSVRRSVAPGTHTVTYESPVDSISLTHNIKNRAGLASGAVMAAEFLAEKAAAGEHGIYSMKDLLKL